jgi:hypothetical protein
MSTSQPEDEPEFTPEQLDALLRQAGEQARRKAFAAGRPVMILRKGLLVRQYADGREVIVGPARMPPVPRVRG